MSKDITFCNNNTCIHRRGCQRWTGNYRELPMRYAIITSPIENCEQHENRFNMLLRVRNSNIEGYLD